MTNEKITDPPGPISTAMKVLAYPLSAMTGGYYAYKIVRSHSYHNLRALGVFDEGLKAHDKVSAHIPPDGVCKDVRAEIKSASRNYAQYIDKRFAELGYSNIIDRYHNLHRGQKPGVMMAFASGAGITFGVLYTLADNQSIQQLFTEPSKNGTQAAQR